MGKSRAEGPAPQVQARPGHGRTSISAARPHFPLVGTFKAQVGGAGVDPGNIPLEPTSHLLYKEELTPSLHTLIHTQASEEEPQTLASS
jgi:hypothetical protein